MKKLFVAGLMATLLFLGATNVNAMTESELREKIAQKVEVSDGTLSMKADDLKLVDSYLKAYELSSEDCQYIADRIDDAVKILKKEGKVELKNLSDSAKSELKDLVAKVDAKTSVKATVKDGKIVVYNDDNTVFAEVTDLVKQTGSETSPIAMVAGISFMVTLVGACLVIKQLKNNN